jgi:hypothetical protein
MRNVDKPHSHSRKTSVSETGVKCKSKILYIYHIHSEWTDLLIINRYYENKINSDVIDILGFMAYETIRNLTEKGLEVKYEWEKKGVLNPNSSSGKLFLFDRVQLDQTPLLPEHIQEAFRRLSAVEPQPLGRLRGYHVIGSHPCI